MNPGLPRCRQILYQLSHKGNPRILEWVVYSSPADLPDPGIEPRVSCIGKPLQYSRLENPMGGGTWWATVHRVARSWTRLSNFTSLLLHCRRILCQLSFQGSPSKEPACKCRKIGNRGFHLCVGRIPWRRACQFTPVFLPGETHGQRSLAGCTESDTTEATWHTHTYLPSVSV